MATAGTVGLVEAPPRKGDSGLRLLRTWMPTALGTAMLVAEIPPVSAATTVGAAFDADAALIGHLRPDRSAWRPTRCLWRCGGCGTAGLILTGRTRTILTATVIRIAGSGMLASPVWSCSPVTARGGRVGPVGRSAGQSGP